LSAGEIGEELAFGAGLGLDELESGFYA
jgi:hypothetical protein